MIYALYNFFLTVFFLVGIPYLFLRLLFFRNETLERLGFLPTEVPSKRKNKAHPYLWFHASSVGEVVAVSSIINSIRKEYAEAEAKKLAESLVMIEKLVLTGKINEEQAKLHFQIQRNATRMVLLTIEGLGIIAVEQAINAALDVLKDTVNTALDFTLL